MPDITPAQLTSVDALAPLPGSTVPATAEQLEAELQQLRDNAQTEGFNAGMSHAAEEVATALQALHAAEQQRRSLVQNISRRLEAEAVELAFALAEQMIDQQLELRSDTILPIVETALDHVADAETVHVYVAEDDLAVVEEATAELHQQIAGAVRVHTDTTLQRGDCRVESDVGDVDATRATRMQQLRSRLNEVRHERGAR